jgi:Putative zinc-finger
MKLLTCAAVRRRMMAFHDGELPARDRLAVETHLDGCPRCASEAAALDRLGDALRGGAHQADDLTGLRADILSRVKADHERTLNARMGRLFEDLHLVWIGLAATTATLICSVIVLGALAFASPGRSDSLAAMMNQLGATPGSNLNPYRLDAGVTFPRFSRDDYMPTVALTEQEAVLALAAVVTKEGRVSGFEVLSDEGDRREVLALLEALRRARFAPAEFGGAPVAVNMIWLVSHTTVRRKTSS